MKERDERETWWDKVGDAGGTQEMRVRLRMVWGCGEGVEG